MKRQLDGYRIMFQVFFALADYCHLLSESILSCKYRFKNKNIPETRLRLLTIPGTEKERE